MFENLSPQEIAQDPLVLDRFPKTLSCAEYESKWYYEINRLHKINSHINYNYDHSV